MNHQAAILKAKAAGKFELVSVPTPTPGPHDVLIQVKAVGLNPIDYYQRDMGFPPIANYPACIGSDVGGVTLSVGSEVKGIKVGDRVSAYATSYYTSQAINGALQEKTIVGSEYVTVIPSTLSFVDAALLPMSVATAWNGWFVNGLGFNTKHTPADKKGMLIWGGGGCVGSAVVQIARSLGYVVFTTASLHHTAYLKTLGASYVFDYKSPTVVADVAKAAKDAG